MPRWYPEEQTDLAQIRVRAGLSRDKAAVQLKIASNTLLRYEHGKNDIGIEMAERMAALYGVSFEEICEAARKVRKFTTSSKFAEHKEVRWDSGLIAVKARAEDERRYLND